MILVSLTIRGTIILAPSESIWVLSKFKIYKCSCVSSIYFKLRTPSIVKLFMSIFKFLSLPYSNMCWTALILPASCKWFWLMLRVSSWHFPLASPSIMCTSPWSFKSLFSKSILFRVAMNSHKLPRTTPDVCYKYVYLSDSLTMGWLMREAAIVDNPSAFKNVLLIVRS